MTRVAIGAIMKDEGPYILEWVAYHKSLGFKLIIADHGGGDETSKILTFLHNAGVIYRIDFRFKKELPQIPAYRAILHRARKSGIDIIGFLDCDEFFTKTIPISSLSPSDGAAHIESEFKRLNATQISYHWLLYGSKTYSEDEKIPVLQRFSHHSHWQTKENRMVKSFILVKEMFKLKNLFFFSPKIVTSHNFHGANRRWIIDDDLVKKFDINTQHATHQNGAILHYIIKTWDEYQRKVNRGRALIGNTRYTAEFFRKNDLNEIYSPIPDSLIIELTHKIDDLNILIGNYSLQEVEPNFLTDVKVWVNSLGFSDIANHKFLFTIYKIVKEIRRYFAEETKSRTG